MDVASRKKSWAPFPCSPPQKNTKPPGSPFSSISLKNFKLHLSWSLQHSTLYIPSPYHVFLYFLEGQVDKDNKLGIMTNVGKSRLVKFIFTNIHKINGACENSFGRYIMIAQCMRNVFTFYYINSLEKWCFWEN